MGHELAVFRAMSGRGDTDLYPELVWPMRLALADASWCAWHVVPIRHSSVMTNFLLGSLIVLLAWLLVHVVLALVRS
jgi:hypothetical protein